MAPGREIVRGVLVRLAAMTHNRLMLEPGSAAPDFEVQDHTGTTRRLADYRGRAVVLWFYPRADTPG
jgi:peroxiredoxin Q/BCP